MDLLDTGITVVNDSVKGIRKHTKPCRWKCSHMVDGHGGCRLILLNLLRLLSALALRVVAGKWSLPNKV